MAKNTFNDRCYALLKKVPAGKVTTYKDLAQALKSKAYRAVGNAMNKNPNAPIVPCHRVIKSDGGLGGYAYGPSKKLALLRKEGVNIKKDLKIDLDKYRFKW